MKLLFVHQNFPGQYLNLAPRMARGGHDVVAVSSRPGVKFDGVKIVNYEAPGGAPTGAHRYLDSSEAPVGRGERVAELALQMKKAGFTPDVICAHPGWGESLYLRDVWRQSPQLHYCEFFFHSFTGPSQFRPQEEVALDQVFGLRTRSSIFLLALNDCDAGVTPTHWQHAQYPIAYQPMIEVAHDGIRTDYFRPRPDATVTLPSGRTLSRSDRVVTYVSRNLEPVRGFPEFMRAVSLVQQREPETEFVVLGGDEVSYGAPAPGGDTWREKMLREVDLDLSHVHFLGKVPYDRYLSILQLSSAHVYLTVPYVLSWSLMEAMAAGCLVIASGTEPVREVVEDGRNGLLVDFFDAKALAAKIIEPLDRQDAFDDLRRAARQTICERYSLAACLPRHIEQIKRLAKG